MSEQPRDGSHDTADDPREDGTPEPAAPEHGNVRTAGETAVDDAIGGADDPPQPPTPR
jgi:hypothetical protein